MSAEDEAFTRLVDAAARNPALSPLLGKATRIVNQVNDYVEHPERLWERFQQQRQAPQPQKPPPPKGMSPAIARQLLHFGPGEPLDRAKIKSRQRALAAMVHPDRGGDNRAMAQLNEAATILLNSLG